MTELQEIAGIKAGEKQPNGYKNIRVVRLVTNLEGSDTVATIYDSQGYLLGVIIHLVRGDCSQPGYYIGEEGVGQFLYPPKVWKPQSKADVRKNRFDTLAQAERAFIEGLQKYTKQLFE